MRRNFRRFAEDKSKEVTDLLLFSFFSDGSEIPQTVPGLNVINQDSQDIREELNALRSRIQELEDSVQCSICMDASRSVAFLCGHSACVDCADTLQQCHMCRKPIQKKINLF